MGFYPSEMFDEYKKYGSLPDDLKEISKEAYENYFSPPDGYYSIFDEKGPRIEKRPEPDYVAIAESKKAEVLAEVTASTATHQTKLLMGRKLTQTEMASLNEWMDYSDKINALDLTTAPDVAWPAKPGQAT